MNRRLPFLPLALMAAIVAPALVEAAPGDGVKKLKQAAEALGQIKGAVPADDARLAAAAGAIEAAGQQNDADAAKALLGLLVTPFPQSASVELFVADRSRDALVSLSDPAARDEVRSALEKKKREANIAVPLAGVVSGWNEEASARSLGELLSQRDDRILKAGARGLSTLGRKEGVRPLIVAFTALHEAGGEPLEAVGRALVSITGQTFREPADWSKWWDSVEATWDPSQKAPASGSGGTVTRFSGDGPSFFGSVEVRSKKIVFVLDVSGSMHIRNYIQEPLPPPPRREASGSRPPASGGSQGRPPAEGSTPGSGGAQGGGAPGGGAATPPADPNDPAQNGAVPPPMPPGVDPRAPGYKPKPCTFHQCPGAKGTGPPCPSDENLPTWYQRHDRLMRQVESVILHLPESTQFNLIAFSSDARAWRGQGLAVADERTKRNAAQWVGSLRPGGATSADKAIDLAFTIEEADTIIFVTDGAPTNPAGRPYDESRWRELLDAVQVKNKVRNVRIDVIAIAEGSTGFGRMLASENGGTFTTVP